METTNMFIEAVEWLLGFMEDLSGSFPQINSLFERIGGWTGVTSIGVSLILTIIALKVVDLIL